MEVSCKSLCHPFLVYDQGSVTMAGGVFWVGNYRSQTLYNHANLEYL